MFKFNYYRDVPRILILWALTCGVCSLHAQNFPVRTSVSIVNPSPYLEDYGREGNVVVVATLVDDQATYDGQLVFTLSGDGFRARTRAGFGMPVTLRRGQPYLLRGSELAPYFQLNNLEVSGSNAETLLNGGSLPDGPLTLCVEVFDRNRTDAPPVNNPTCATRFVQQHYPPQLVGPLEAVAASPAINFRWNPRHGIITANDEYAVEVWEMIPGLTPDQIINSTPPLRPAVVTGVPNYVFTNYDALLEAGKRYLWRVQVRDRRDARRFINNGFSEPGQFVFGTLPEECAPLGNFFAENVRAGRATLSWRFAGEGEIEGIELKLREAAERGSWQPAISVDEGSETFPLTGLIPETTYEAELRIGCPDGSFLTEALTFATPASTEDCGDWTFPTTTPLSATAVAISWPEVGAATGYRLSWRPQDVILPAASPSPDSTLLPGDASQATLDGLTEGVAYQLKLCKLCPDGTEECYDWILPASPAQRLSMRCPASYAPRLLELQKTSAKLGPDTEVPDIGPVEWRYANRDFENWAPLGTGREASARNLSPGAVYRAQLRTLCPDSSWSVWSDPLLFGPDCRIDGQPTVSAIASKSATVDATVVTTASAYHFEYRRYRANEDWSVATTSTTPSIDLSGLLADTEYEVRVRASCGKSLSSNTTDAVRFRTLPPCDAPTPIAVSDIRTESVELDWPAFAGASAYDLEYRLRYAAQSQAQTSYGISGPTPVGGSWQRIDGVTPPFALGSLSAGAAYDFRVRSDCGGAQYSDWTAIDTFALSCAPPDGLYVDQLTYESARITLGSSSSNAQTHEFAYRLLGDSSWMVRPFGNDRITLAELDDLSVYEVRARSSCAGGGMSDWSATVQFQTPVKCLAPENLGLTSLGTNSASVSWDVTGTVSLWEVRWLDVEEAQRIVTNGQATQTHSAGNTYTDPESGSPENENAPGSMTAPPATAGASDPYADWQVTTVTEPSLTKLGLKADRSYRVVVRAECPTFGTTDYSEVLAFRTRCHTGTVDTLLADQLTEREGRLRWPRILSCREDYQLIVETAFDPGAPVSAIGDPPSGSGPYAPVGAATTSEASDPIYRDTFVTGAEEFMLSSLLPDTEYRVKLRASFSKSDFDAGSDGRLTTADWLALCHAAGSEIIAEEGWGPYSEWYTFKTDHCALPLAITETIVARDVVELSWLPSRGDNLYEVAYRPYADPPADWLTFTVEAPLARLENLDETADYYEYRIAEVCSGGGFQTAPQDSFLLGRPDLSGGLYVCGVDVDIDLSQQTPLPTLAAGDTIRMYDFPVVVTRASGENGRFSGVGELRIPYFKRAKAQFEFDSVFVNIDRQIVDGYMEATGFGLEVLNESEERLLKKIMDYLGQAEEYLTQQQLKHLKDVAALGENNNLPQSLKDQIDAAIDCYDDAKTEAAKDSCEVLLEAALASVDSFMALTYDGNFQVTFHPHSDQHYGFDAKRPQDPEEWFEKRTISGEEYYISYKSALAGTVEKISASIPEGKSDSVVFSQRTTDTLPVEIANNVAEIDFSVQPDDPYYLVAKQPDLAPPRVVGMTEIVPYEALTLNVSLVPVGFTPQLDPGAIETELDRIFRQAVVDAELTVEPPLSVSGYDGRLDSVGSSLLSSYSQEMRDIIRAHKDNRSPDDDTYYLFLIDDYASTTLAGYMPPGRQYGFIYEGNAGGGAAYARTLAHELCHGAYHLEHIWEEAPALDEGTTDNLMDYGSGTRLHKWQWDLIHNPRMAPILPSDEDGAYQGLQDMAFLDEFRNGDGTLTFVSPAGLPVTLPADTRSVRFNTGDNVRVNADCYDGFGVYPFGSLRNFTDASGNTYHLSIDCELSGQFLGYIKYDQDSNKVAYVDTLSKQIPYSDRTAVFILPYSAGGLVGWKAFETDWRGLDYNSLGYETPDQNNYRAKGPRSNYNKLIKISKQGGRPLSLIDYDLLSSTAQSLLTTVASSPDVSPSTLAYAYTHAHQMSRYPGLESLCAFQDISGINLDQLKGRFANLYEAYENPDQNTIWGSGADFVFDHNHAIYSSLFGSNELDDWEEADESIYMKYDKLREQIFKGNKSVLDFPDDTQGANDLLKLLKDWQKIPCAYRELSLAERLHILKVLRHADLNQEWLWGLFGEEQEGMYNSILMLNAPEDYEAVLSLYTENDNALFWQIQENFTEVAYDFFVSILSKMALETTNKAMADFGYKTVAGSALDSVRMGVVFEKGETILPDQQPVQVIDAFFQYPARYFRSDISRSGNSGTYTIAAGAYGLGQVDYEQSSSDPFKMVILHFVHDAVFSVESGIPVNIQAGKSIMVPICLAEVIFRYYIDKDSERKFKTVMTVVAITAAVVAIATTGGTATGVILAVVATADAAAQLGVYVLSNDDYEWEVTGNGAYSRKIHEAVNKLKKLTGYISLASGVTQAAGKTLVKLTDVKKVVEESSKASVSLSGTILGNYKALKRAMSAYKFYHKTDANFESARRHLMLELAAHTLNASSTVRTSNTTLHLDDSYNSLLLKDGQQIVLGTGTFIGKDEDYYIIPAYWAGADTLGGVQHELTDVGYIDQTGEPTLGTLRYYEDASNPYRYRAVAVPHPEPHTLKYADFYRLFQDKGWNWPVTFSNYYRTYVDQIDPYRRGELIDLLGAWPSGAEGDAALVALENDLKFASPIFATSVLAVPSRINAWLCLYAPDFNGNQLHRRSLDFLKVITVSAEKFSSNDGIGWPALLELFERTAPKYYPDLIELFSRGNSYFTAGTGYEITASAYGSDYPKLVVSGQAPQTFPIQQSRDNPPYTTPNYSTDSTSAAYFAHRLQFLEIGLPPRPNGAKFSPWHILPESVARFVTKLPTSEDILDIHIAGGYDSGKVVHAFTGRDGIEFRIEMTIDQFIDMIASRPEYDRCVGIRLFTYGYGGEEIARRLGKPCITTESGVIKDADGRMSAPLNSLHLFRKP